MFQHSVEFKPSHESSILSKEFNFNSFENQIIDGRTAKHEEAESPGRVKLAPSPAHDEGRKESIVSVFRINRSPCHVNKIRRFVMSFYRLEQEVLVRRSARQLQQSSAEFGVLPSGVVSKELRSPFFGRRGDRRFVKVDFEADTLRQLAAVHEALFHRDLPRWDPLLPLLKCEEIFWVIWRVCALLSKFHQLPFKACHVSCLELYFSSWNNEIVIHFFSCTSIHCRFGVSLSVSLLTCLLLP